MTEDELFRARVDKLRAIESSGADPWPVRYDRTHFAAELTETYAGLEAGAGTQTTVQVAGRLGASRVQGKIAFGDLVDSSGRIQLFVTGDLVEPFDALDSGDHIGASGEVIRTKRGELSVRVDDIVLLAKALRPPPDKWHGLRNVEVRYRNRHLDLLANPEARRLARVRAGAVSFARSFFDGRGFVEVETPVLHPIPGGGAARPFVTHYEALDMDMYLRVAPELYLKRLVIGGLERVYELARVFRNEGMSYKHSPESTMLEAYQAYADYLDIMELVEAFVVEAAREVVGGTAVTFRGHDLDLGKTWRRVTMVDLISEVTGEAVGLDTPAAGLRDLCSRHGVAAEEWWGVGQLIGELYDKVAEPAIVEPTLVCDYPVEISPLARRHRDDPRLVERFEAVICGMELGNAFSELNDPLDQRARFEDQMRAREHGDIEANPIDEPYIRALEYGMPPTGGLGVGVDRLSMVLGGADSIRETILFPAVRPEAADSEEDVT